MKKETKKGETYRIGYQEGVKEENEAWLKGLRCVHCGKTKEKNLTEMCYTCLEEA